MALFSTRFDLGVRHVAPMLFGSGLCSLVYQVAWFRELRLVFGASTAASAAVLAIFIGGIGTGSLLLGKRADTAKNPLGLYGNLELVIAVSAAASPFLLSLVRKLYIASGGTPALGLAAGTGIRLALAALVLAAPTLAMGGTLAAAARAIETDGDARRRSLAILYGTNTLGAVCGALVSTFFLLEVFGTIRSILVAALINALVALIARSTSRRVAVPVDAREHSGAEGAASPVELSLPVVLAASAVVGFVFFLMEMTWYRMLGPILGGTVFTFGLILAAALLGIGLGGLIYALRPAARTATAAGLAATCLVEAVCLAIPFALGDRIAYAASAAKGSAVFGFAGQVAGWALICGTVVVPAAIASGVQFPLLVNLVGKGRSRVGRQLGMVYAANTVGAIVGSLVGGFVLLPTLGAVRCWWLAVVMLVAVAAIVFSFIARRSSWRVSAPLGALAVLAIGLAFAPGPTAAWRHSGIGAGRAARLDDPTSARNFANRNRRIVKWEADGVESSVALAAYDGLAFVVNGKVDGNAFVDAATQMMGGLLGSAIHPAPKRGLVIGLGTGETTGWFADVPGMERVDVIELEPAILGVARACAPLNRDVLNHPKVHVSLGDAREHLLVARSPYDVIVSEPSNPYRAGVSSLFTREFYQAVRDRLGKNGLFLQWTQSYEVDGDTIATIYATLSSVFPEIHTWRLGRTDLLFVASSSPIVYDAQAIAARIAAPVFHDAADFAWHVNGVEGFMSHYIGSSALAAEIARRAAGINTDDQTRIEFAFAHTLGQQGLNNIAPLRAIASELRDDRPKVVGSFDWGRFEEDRAIADAFEGDMNSIARAKFADEPRARVEARTAYIGGNPVSAIGAWRRQQAAPRSHFELLLVTEGLAMTGGPEAEAYIAALRPKHPVEADFALAQLRVNQKRWDEAAQLVIPALARIRTDAFVDRNLVGRVLRQVPKIAGGATSYGPRLVDALIPPFAVYMEDESRLSALLATAAVVDDAAVARALDRVEPNIRWDFGSLTRRAAAYAALRHPLAGRAQTDLEEFFEAQAMPLLPTALSSDVPAPDESPKPDPASDASRLD
jgi:spermidine synthase